MSLQIDLESGESLKRLGKYLHKKNPQTVSEAKKLFGIHESKATNVSIIRYFASKIKYEKPITNVNKLKVTIDKKGNRHFFIQSKDKEGHIHVKKIYEEIQRNNHVFRVERDTKGKFVKVKKIH